MKPRRKDTSNRALMEGIVRAGTFVLMTALLVGLTRSIYRNYSFNGQLENARGSINELRLQNEELADLKKFYQSTAYRDREAREKLNLKLPDENVLIIPDSEIPDSVKKGPDNPAVKPSGPAADYGSSHFLEWWHFIFG